MSSKPIVHEQIEAANKCPGCRKKIECPVSAGVLNDLYWKNRKNLHQIAEHLHEQGLTDRKVSWGKVRAWFTELEVPVATPKQNVRRGLATKREKYGSVSKILRGRSWSLNEEQKRRLSVIRKGKKLGKSTPEQLGHLEMECACCTEKFRRPPSGVRSSFRYGRRFVYFYCSQECRKKGARFSEAIQAEALYFSTEWYVAACQRAGIGPNVFLHDEDAHGVDAEVEKDEAEDE